MEELTSEVGKLSQAKIESRNCKADALRPSYSFKDRMPESKKSQRRYQ
jgi:hypothetical protein